MLLSASPGGRRGLQALCRLACSGIDAAVSASASSRLPPGSSVRAEEQRWSHSGAASTPAPFSSWLGVTTQTAHERSGGAHARSAACSRGVWWLLEPSPPSVCSPPGAAAGAARGAKTQAAQQRGGSKQQQLRQRRAPADDYPPVDQKGVVSVLSTKNNTIITLADEAGNVKAWSSAGEAGFKGARRATSYASEAAAQKLAAAALQLGFREVKLRMRGLGEASSQQ